MIPDKNIRDDDEIMRTFPASFRMKIRYWVSRYVIIENQEAVFSLDATKI